MAAPSSNSSLLAIRAIARELRHSLGKRKITHEPAMQYILSQARVHDMTDGRTCRPINELKFMANVYACYLNSTRRFNELHSQYGSKEKSVEDAAKTVGLSLPKKPQD